MSWLSRFLRRNHRPSEETEKTRERLDNIYRDDAKIEEVVREREQIIRQNHLGPIIAKALRGNND